MAASVGGVAPSPFTLASKMAPLWYNSVRNDEGRLDSSPVPLTFSLDASLARQILSDVNTMCRNQGISPEEALTRVIKECLSVDVCYYDGSPVCVFCPGSAVRETLVAAPQIVQATFEPQDAALTVMVTRKLPLSSAHGNRYMRLGFVFMGYGVEHVVFTPAVSVLAKQAPGAERKQKYFAQHKTEPTRPCWLLQRVAQSGLDLYRSFDAVEGGLPLTSEASRKRARGDDSGAGGVPSGPPPSFAHSAAAPGGSRDVSAPPAVVPAPVRAPMTGAVTAAPFAQQQPSQLAAMKTATDSTINSMLREDSLLAPALDRADSLGTGGLLSVPLPPPPDADFGASQGSMPNFLDGFDFTDPFTLARHSSAASHVSVGSLGGFPLPGASQ